MAKIFVEIISPDGSSKTKKCKTISGKAIIKKQTKRHAERSATFDNNCVVTYGTWLRKKRKVILREDAKECIPILKNNLKVEEIPIWDADTEEKLFDANVIKATGTTSAKVQIPMSIYLLLIIITVLSFITLLQSMGKIKLG
jgi:hypothetical protein